MTTITTTCKNCDEPIYEFVETIEGFVERNWLHETTQDVLCDTDLRRLVTDEDDFHALFEAASIALPRGDQDVEADAGRRFVTTPCTGAEGCDARGSHFHR